MAFRAKITTDYGDNGIQTEGGFSVSETVGFDGQNDKGDVMLIQAMFMCIAWDARNPTLRLGTPRSHLPEPTGVFGRSTGKMILNFQRKYSYKLIGPIDGIIHPADFEGRTIGLKGKQMTITLLNAEVQFGLPYSHLPFADVFVSRFPQLRPWLMQGSAHRVRNRTTHQMNLP